MTTFIKLLGPRVLVRRAAAPDQTLSGLFVPKYWTVEDDSGNTIGATGRELPNVGTVVAVGTHRNGKLLPVRPGDLVMFPKFHDRTVMIDGETLLVLRHNELLVKIEGEPER